MEAVNKSGLERQRWTHGVQRVGEAEVDTWGSEGWSDRDTWGSVGWRDRDGLMGFRGLERERWTHGVQRVWGIMKLLYEHKFVQTHRMSNTESERSCKV